MRDHDPHLLVEMRVGGTPELMQAYEAVDLDAVLVFRPQDRREHGRAAATGNAG